MPCVRTHRHVTARDESHARLLAQRHARWLPPRLSTTQIHRNKKKIQSPVPADQSSLPLPLHPHHLRRAPVHDPSALCSLGTKHPHSAFASALASARKKNDLRFRSGQVRGPPAPYDTPDMHRHQTAHAEPFNDARSDEAPLASASASAPALLRAPSPSKEHTSFPGSSASPPGSRKSWRSRCSETPGR